MTSQWSICTKRKGEKNEQKNRKKKIHQKTRKRKNTPKDKKKKKYTKRQVKERRKKKEKNLGYVAPASQTKQNTSLQAQLIHPRYRIPLEA